MKRETLARAETILAKPGAQADAANDFPLRLPLRWLADTYERVQGIRLEAGERVWAKPATLIRWRWPTRSPLSTTEP